MSVAFDRPPANLDAFAAETIAKGSKSFAAAARLFDPATRRSVMLLYAWCRHCDDVIDGQHLGFAKEKVEPAANPGERLRALERQTRRAFAGEPTSEPSFRALQEVAARHNLPERLALDHLRGFGMDVEGRRYRTLTEALDYCYGVAGVVGVMMAMIMGVREPGVLDRACDLGLAFQLTNIARDVVEDARSGRSYLPTQWLDEEGVPLEDIAAPEHREKLAAVVGRLVRAAEPYYASALGGLGALPPRSAWAIATAHGVYRQIGLDVRALGARAWDRRVATSRADKLRHVARGAALAMTSRLATPASRPAELWTRPSDAWSGGSL